MTTADAPRDDQLLTGVWAELIGQERAVRVLRRAVADAPHAMSHAWLLTGPPGSGRSNAARAFAAALECDDGGCGVCNACRTALAGSHPDITLVRTETLSIGVDEVRELVRRAAMSPSRGRRQVVVVEDADRVTERGADALLKAIEEPAPRTVWVLCAPTPEDVIVTIRSRCRRLHLATPRDEAVARLLVDRDGVDPELAGAAARAAQGHIGRARALARNEEARSRRAAILDLPTRLRSLGDCLAAAQRLVDDAAQEAQTATADLDEKERAELERALGLGTKGARPRNAQAALRDLESEQKARVKRLQRDALDRVLTELTTFHRDVLAVQTGAVPRSTEAALVGPRLVNAELTTQIHAVAEGSGPDDTVHRIDAILAAREALETNVSPLLAMEAMLIRLAGVDERLR
ncbi:DNA polymerase III subunit delta' [Acidipropionibacterium timonense]|uniref:DNA polymerase III subunit delta' n=1 Tax=Acidipropionibacterium timonense TaxID=2161818 RepID=UPI001030AA19|nr:DNA polymerase III subunit delta' [Acidipropionibacterium timonense]